MQKYSFVAISAKNIFLPKHGPPTFPQIGPLYIFSQKRNIHHWLGGGGLVSLVNLKWRATFNLQSWFPGRSEESSTRIQRDLEY